MGRIHVDLFVIMDGDDIRAASTLVEAAPGTGDIALAPDAGGSWRA
jgi:hypothetical protein